MHLADIVRPSFLESKQQQIEPSPELPDCKPDTHPLMRTDIKYGDLQYELLHELLLSYKRKGKRTEPKQATCLNDSHVLSCGHLLRPSSRRQTRCTTACLCTEARRGLIKLTENPADLGIKNAFYNFSCNPEADDMDMSYQTKNFEDSPVCPRCWLVECMIRFYFFVKDSQFGFDNCNFDNKERITNPVPVALFPQVLETSRRFNGQMYHWTGPEIILEWCEKAYLPGLVRTVHYCMIRRGVETPLEELPLETCKVSTVQGEGGYLKELKLIPVNRKVKKTVKWADEKQVFTIPAREIDEEKSAAPKIEVKFNYPWHNLGKTK